MTLRATATLVLLALANALTLPAAAQSRIFPPLDVRLVPAAIGMSTRFDAPPALLTTPLSSQISRKSNALAYGLVGALLGGLAAAAYLANGCSQTDCIVDPVAPIATGAGIGFVIGFAIGGGIRAR